MRRLTHFAVVLVLFILPDDARAAEQPDIEEVKAQFLLQVPGYWGLSEFNIEASANYGTEVEPVIKHRFTAEVELRNDTFVLESKDGAVTWITPLARAGDKRIVYGIATSTLKAGAWQTDFALENNPTQRLGQPRDFFSGRVIARGSSEEMQFREEQMKTRESEAALKHQQELARRAREEELKERERKAELTRVGHDARVREEERKRKAQEAVAAKAEEAALFKELEERARNQFTLLIPRYWKVNSLTVKKPVRLRAKNQPAIKHGFYAEIELTEDTFVEAAKDGPVVFLSPVAMKNERLAIDGVATSFLTSSGTWDMKVELANHPVPAKGQPVDYFAGRVIVKGTPEEKAYWDQKHQEELVRRKREEELQEQEGKVELARLAYEERLRQEKRKVELASQALEAKLKEKKRKQQIQAEAAARARRQQKIAALEAAVADDDQTKWRAALESALASGDQELQRIALGTIFSRTKLFVVNVRGKDDRGNIMPGVVNLRVESFDKNSGLVIGRFDGSDIRRILQRKHVLDSGGNLRRRAKWPRFEGRLSGNTFSGADAFCKINVSLKSGHKMEGTFGCDQIVSATLLIR